MADNFILSWDSAFVEGEDEGVYTPLEEGDYDFTVESYTKRFAKDGQTPVLELVIRIGNNTVRDWLHLKQSTTWKINQFLRCIGQKKHGESARFNFDTLVGSTGRCHVVTDTFQKRDGGEGHGNKIDRYYDPVEKQDSPKLGW